MYSADLSRRAHCGDHTSSTVEGLRRRTSATFVM
jgi:hypothetical protein